MNNSKYKLVIFETNISDGIMSPNKKFYPKDYTDKQIETEFLNTRLKAGKKYYAVTDDTVAGLYSLEFPKVRFF